MGHHAKMSSTGNRFSCPNVRILGVKWVQIRARNAEGMRSSVAYLVDRWRTNITGPSPFRMWALDVA